jgi:hypothetical protein
MEIFGFHSIVVLIVVIIIYIGSFQASPLEINGRQIYVEERKPNSGIRGGSKFVSVFQQLYIHVCALMAAALVALFALTGNFNDGN